MFLINVDVNHRQAVDAFDATIPKEIESLLISEVFQESPIRDAMTELPSAGIIGEPLFLGDYRSDAGFGLFSVDPGADHRLEEFDLRRAGGSWPLATSSPSGGEPSIKFDPECQIFGVAFVFPWLAHYNIFS